MFSIVAKLDQYGKVKVQIIGAPPRAVVELRIQNTMNGKFTVLTSECDPDGVGPVNLVDFGQYYAITARILTEENQEILYPLHFADIDPNGSKYVMVPSAQDAPLIEHATMPPQLDEQPGATAPGG